MATECTGQAVQHRHVYRPERAAVLLLAGHEAVEIYRNPQSRALAITFQRNEAFDRHYYGFKRLKIRIGHYEHVRRVIASVFAGDSPLSLDVINRAVATPPEDLRRPKDTAREVVL